MDLESSEESNSIQSQSSESESSESTSEDKQTSEESNSQSDEDVAIDLMIETRDDSMGSEENIRKSWVQRFASVIKDLSAEDNSRMEIRAQPDHLTEKQPTLTSSRESTSHESTSRESTSSESTSSESTSRESTSRESTTSESTSSESDQTNETSEESDSSSEESKSLEDSNASDSDELQQIKAPDCVKGTQSCEYFFQDIGDDAQYSVDNLMMPEEAERELHLRR
ncbi:hypothetical protein KUCAC02_015607 [Chaenocephalus aceratus]|uniref:Uncharacterized protein n=1 Tax=Chaenocephalus aceratus TaxID=36190 RepID=A0ACB9Y099_CHAAC|nr:hypothetical protein KUCAC02_015607 [Chaenocephalus aceratus]